MELSIKMFVFALLTLLSIVSLLIFQREANKVMKVQFKMRPQKQVNRTLIDKILERIMRRSKHICQLPDGKSSKFNETLQKELLQALSHAAEKPKVTQSFEFNGLWMETIFVTCLCSSILDLGNESIY